MVNISAVLQFDVNVIVVVRPVQESYRQISGFVGVSAELTVVALAGPIPFFYYLNLEKYSIGLPVYSYLISKNG